MKNRILPVKARILFLSALVGAAIVTLPGAHAARIIVTSRADSGDGTLRKALAIASDGDIITFSFWVTGTISLTSGELSVNKSVTINGPGTNLLAVDGNHASRVFYIAPSKTVSISGLTVRNGRARDGAGIYNNHATVTLNNSTISGNSTTTTGVGGGIYNDGSNRGSATLTASNSTISGNSTLLSGGGIYNDGSNRGSATVTVNNSTISGNSAVFSGGGGGGICNESATVTVNNSTISGNSAATGGGIYNDGYEVSATLTAKNSTISGNSAAAGGGIRNDGRWGSTILTGTILNAGASGGNIVNSNGGTITSHGYNLSSDIGGGYLTGIGDRINTDPRLGRLANNGGPTFTHALLSDSPAIGAGDPNFIPPPEYDQRGPGFPRVMNGRIDIGSFEVFHATTITVINTADSGAGSLRQALASASDGDTIDFSGSVTGTITLTSGELLVGKSVTISGPGAANLTVDGDGRNIRHTPHRVFHISPGKTVSISGLTIANGMPVLGGVNGGGIYNDHAILTVNNCTIRDNRATFNGGGIHNAGGGGSATVTVNNSTIKDNLTSRIGGIYNAGEFDGSAATLTISNSTISGNSAGDYGGGIYNTTSIIESASATVTVNNSTINGNTGGILNRGASSSATVINSTIRENSAREFIGGGISSVDYGWLDLSGTILDFNEGRNIYSSNDARSTSHGYNLSSDDSMFGWTATGDQMNTDPLLGPLQDNGGPTFTHALLPASPAIDAGNPNFTPPPDYDQRGPDFLRVANGRIDIGSFELQPMPRPTPTPRPDPSQTPRP